jgi:IS5 family transposase
VLQTLYNLADEQVEYQIRDRLSFMRFLGLGLETKLPPRARVERKSIKSAYSSRFPQDAPAPRREAGF